MSGKYYTGKSTGITDWPKGAADASDHISSHHVVGDYKMISTAKEADRMRAGWLAQAARDAPEIVRLEVESDMMREIIKGFLECPEIADCAPEDKDTETNDLERRARALLPPEGTKT